MTNTVAALFCREVFDDGAELVSDDSSHLLLHQFLVHPNTITYKHLHPIYPQEGVQGVAPHDRGGDAGGTGVGCGGGEGRRRRRRKRRWL